MVRENGNMAQKKHVLRSDPGYVLLRDCIYDAKDELRELFERWNNSLTVEGISFAEKYIEGRISVILYVEFTAAEASVNQNRPAESVQPG